MGDQAAIISPARYVQDYFDEMGKGDSYTTEEVKTLVMSNLILSDPLTSFNLQYCFNPGVSTTNQTYIYRSFFKAGIPIGNGKVCISNITCNSENSSTPLIITHSLFYSACVMTSELFSCELFKLYFVTMYFE